MHKLKQNNAIYRKKGEMAIVCLSKIKINYFEINPDFYLDFGNHHITWNLLRYEIFSFF